MKAVHSMIAAAAFAFVLAAPADAAQTDPEIIIYRFPGVRDTGAPADSGIATVFHCTNFSGAAENIRLVSRNFDSTIATNTVHTINHLNTLTFATHNTTFFSLNLIMNTGTLNQGTVALAATSTSIVCSAMILNMAGTPFTAVTLPGIRFAPVPGSQE